jgi:protein-tyrosine phosphatase
MQIVNPIFDGALETIDMDRVHWLANFAADHIRGGGVVLSHCQMGWNRSGLISGLTMLELGFKGDIVKTIQAARGSGALSNRGFAQYIQLLQEGLPRQEALDALTRPQGRMLDSMRMDIACLEEDIESMSDEQLQEWLDRMGF